VGVTDPLRDRAGEASPSGGPPYEHSVIDRRHPLAPALPLLRQTLVDIADRAMHVMIVTDERGLVLCRERPLDVLMRTYHPWTCAAAPIHDPETGRFIGAVDVAEPARPFHPTTLKLVVAAARLAECHLAAQAAVRAEIASRSLPIRS